MAAVVMTSGTIAKGEYVNEWRQVGEERWVNKYNILGTTMVDYAVWEPYTSGRDAEGHYTRTHSTLTRRDGGAMLGDVSTRDIPAEIDALPVGGARSSAVTRWYRAQYVYAQSLVLAAFPEDFPNGL